MIRNQSGSPRQARQLSVQNIDLFCQLPLHVPELSWPGWCRYDLYSLL